MRMAAIRVGVMVAVMASAAAAAPGPVGDADARAAGAVVTRWLEAQNRGDFAAYEALYAPAFTGVKRVGRQVKKLDRAGWFEDRKAMFRSKMIVAATNQAVTTQDATLIVELDQRWEQGVYADVGRKRLVIGRDDGLIQSEEMLTSRVLLTAPACVKALHPEGRRGRIGPDRTDDAIVATTVFDLGGDRFVCRLDHAARGAKSTTVELAAIGRTKGWAVLSKVEDDLDDAGGETFGQRGEMAVELVGLTASVTAVKVTTTTTEFDDTHANRKESVTLYLVTADGLDDQLTYDATSASDAETSDGTTCELAVGTRKHKGYPDLDVTCTTSKGDWWNEDPSERGVKETTQVAHHVWDGATYAEK